MLSFTKESPRDEADRLVREARTLHKEAVKRRDRTRRLAFRFSRHVRQKWAQAREDVIARQQALDDARGQLSAEVARLEHARSDFNVSTVEENARRAEAWEALDRHRARLSTEWTESCEFFRAQEAAVAARAAELVEREKSLSAARATLESQATSLRVEAIGLEARIQNAREVLVELEQKRLELQAAVEVKPDPEPTPGLSFALDRAKDRDLAAWAAELVAADEKSTLDRAALVALRQAHDRDVAALADQRKVLAEQFALLAAARGGWQEAERRTVGEMEDLARHLRAREQDLDAREERLIRIDARRREEAFELWQLRLKLEAWQSKMTAVERVWHAGREQREAEIARRARTLTHRENALEELIARLERARDGERERLTGELRLWSDDRERLARAADAYDRQARELLAELSTQGARAMASEELGAELDGRSRKKLEAFRGRWEQVFQQKLAEIDVRRAGAADERSRVDDRYREFQKLLLDVTERRAVASSRTARDEAAAYVAAQGPLAVEPEAPTDRDQLDLAGRELAALRSEFERMAVVLMDAGVPEVPDSALPWAGEDAAEDRPADVLPFRSSSQAA